MDSVVDMLFVWSEHKEAAHMVRAFVHVCGIREKEKRLHSTPALIYGYVASCYSNMTSHSFSPAVFDQFSLLLLLANLPLS